MAVATRLRAAGAERPRAAAMAAPTELRLAEPGFRGIQPGAGVAEAHARVRAVSRPWESDREPGPDIEAVTRLVHGGALVDLAAEGATAAEGPTATGAPRA